MNRDTEKFLQVLEAHKGIIYKVANAYCSDNENRKDLVQEITFQLWRSFNRYNDQYKWSTWIYRIALNVSFSFYRKENHRGRVNHPLPEDIFWIKEDLPRTEKDEQIAKLHQAVRKLKEIDRAIILLYLEGKSQQEMAEILNLTATNISTKISRIKQELKKYLTT